MLAREGEKDKEKDEDFEKVKVPIYLYLFLFFLSSQVELKEMSFQLLLEDWQGSSIPDGGGRSFHRPGTVKENVLESDFEPLCDGTTRRRSVADLRLLEGM